MSQRALLKGERDRWHGEGQTVTARVRQAGADGPPQPVTSREHFLGFPQGQAAAWHREAAWNTPQAERDLQLLPVGGHRQNKTDQGPRALSLGRGEGQRCCPRQPIAEVCAAPGRGAGTAPRRAPWAPRASSRRPFLLGCDFLCTYKSDRN